MPLQSLRIIGVTQTHEYCWNPTWFCMHLMHHLLDTTICMNCPRIIDIKQKERSLLLPHWYQLPHFGWKTVLVVMAVLGLWDILLPWMHSPPHLLHLPLLYLTKMCTMWINPAMMEVDYCCHHLHHATSWTDQHVYMWLKFDTTLPWTWLISTHFAEGIERK